jgi:hypothetical protein
MGYIRFRCTAVKSPSDGFYVSGKLLLCVGSVDVTEMAKLRDAGALRLVTSGTQSNFKTGTGRMLW